MPHHVPPSPRPARYQRNGHALSLIAGFKLLPVPNGRDEVEVDRKDVIFCKIWVQYSYVCPDHATFRTTSTCEFVGPKNRLKAHACTDRSNWPTTSLARALGLGDPICRVRRGSQTASLLTSTRTDTLCPQFPQRHIQPPSSHHSKHHGLQCHPPREPPYQAPPGMATPTASATTSHSPWPSPSHLAMKLVNTEYSTYLD